ncbi:hypothetical protein TNCV_3419811 [Trichonephila clavipes]|nr:hypothetical protein TNCV_3419811 [Trichonephila clavipes]
MVLTLLLYGENQVPAICSPTMSEKLTITRVEASRWMAARTYMSLKEALQREATYSSSGRRISGKGRCSSDELTQARFTNFNPIEHTLDTLGRAIATVNTHS